MARPLPTLASRQEPLAQPAAQIAMLRKLPLARDFDAALGGAGLFPLKPTRLEVFQINVGKVCNQTCRHCHVDAGPDRRELMSRETMERREKEAELPPELRGPVAPGAAGLPRR